MTKFTIALLLVIRMVKSLSGLDKEEELNNSILKKDVNKPLTSRNRCISQNNDSKTWGPKCKFMCNCKNNTYCHVTGFCPNGCEMGWARFSKKSPCYKVVENFQSHQGSSEFNLQLNRSSSFLDDHRNLDKEKHIPKQILQSLPVLLSYTFLSKIHCLTKGDFVELSFIAKSSTKIAASHMYVRFHTYFAYRPSSLKAQLYLKGYSRPNEFTFLLHSMPHKKGKAFFKLFKLPVLVDKLRISFALHETERCPSTYGAGVVVMYGVPVCPFRKWGLNCEHRCSCPCDLPECHPVTGSCLFHPLFCPVGKYGRRCEKTCSARCSNSTGGPTAGNTSYQSTSNVCHVVSGYCRVCPSLQQTGRECNVPVPEDEERAILVSCVNRSHATLRTYSIIDAETLIVARNMTSRQWVRGEIAMVLVMTSIFFFFMAFCFYIVCVRLCARRKIRKYKEELEWQRNLRTSIVSWAELKEEFKSMRKMSLLRRKGALSTDTGLDSSSMKKSDSSVDPRRLQQRPNYSLENSQSSNDLREFEEVLGRKVSFRY